MPKKSIRTQMLARRRQLSPEACLIRSRRIQERFLESADFKNSAVLALYSSVRNEVFTEDIFRVARREGKRTVYPLIREKTLEFIEVTDLSELHPGKFGIPEPPENPVVPPPSLDLVLVPGLAFDLAGYRLGYGMGFYDRVFPGGERCLFVGLCFAFQLLKTLPAETHDVRMDLVVTEERTLRFGPSASQ